MSSIIQNVPSLMVFSPTMFPMSMPLSTVLPGSNIIPPLPGSGGGEKGDAATDDPRIIVDVSTFKKGGDPVLDIASSRLGWRMTDAIVLTDNGITEGREDAFKKLMGLKGSSSIRDRLDELFSERGIKESLEDGDDDGRRVIKIRGEGNVSPECFMEYSFLQGVLPPVPLVRRVYNDELYRELHGGFIRTDLDILSTLAEKIYDYIYFARREMAMYTLSWAKSMALGIEVGARQIVDAGGEGEISSFWNDDAKGFLETMWNFIGEGDRALMGERDVTIVTMRIYLSALVYLDSE